MQDHKQQALEERYVKQYGEVGAGKIVPFTPKEGLVPVVVPVGSPKDEYLGTMIVRGVSLEDEGIFDGDTLVCRRDHTKRDIDRNTICIVFIRSTGELVAKKIEYGKLGEYVTLKASGGGIKDVHYPGDDIEVRAIVIAYQRMLRKDRNRDPSIPF